MGTGKSEIKNYILSPEAMVMVAGSSKGTQVKYYENSYWYKRNSNGYEGVTETLVTEILRCSNASDYAEYEQCLVNNANGCRSKNFLNPGENLISFQRLYSIYNNGDLNDRLRGFDKYTDRIDFTLDFIFNAINLNVKSYLSQILTLDMITLNDDRHLNNLAIIADTANNIYKPAPIFDNGGALLSNFNKYPIDEPIESLIEKVVAQPFSVNFEAQVNYIGIGLKINITRLHDILTQYPDSRAKEVLLYQLDRYSGICGG